MKYFLIGITGPTGAGKTYIAQKLVKDLDAEHIDCDRFYEKLLKEDEKLKELLVDAFGSEILTGDAVDKKKLAGIAFSDFDNVGKLNSITHPIITKRIFERIEDSNKKYAILDAPTLIEAGINDKCDAVISVTAPKENRKERVMRRENATAEYINQRMSVQKDDDFYIENSDYHIFNNNKDDTDNIIKEILKKITTNNQ